MSQESRKILDFDGLNGFFPAGSQAGPDPSGSCTYPVVLPCMHGRLSCHHIRTYLTKRSEIGWDVRTVTIGSRYVQ